MKVRRLIAGGLIAWGISSWVKKQRAIRFGGRVAVITGGSRGLGLELARRLAAENATVVLLARRQDELDRAVAELSSKGALTLGLVCDVRKPDEVERAIGSVVTRYGTVDILINNAGVIEVGPIDSMTREDYDSALDIHFKGPLNTVLAAVPHMRRQRSGRIVNIVSIGGKVAAPHLLPYTVSKFALAGFSDGIRTELRRDGIYVTTVFPGFMRTGGVLNAKFKGRHRAEYAWMATCDALPFVSMDPRQAAFRIIEACRYGSARLVVGVPAKVMAVANELMPGLVAETMALFDRALPGAPKNQPGETRTGFESRSRWVPSILARVIERSAARMNQHAPKF